MLSRCATCGSMARSWIGCGDRMRAHGLPRRAALALAALTCVGPALPASHAPAPSSVPVQTIGPGPITADAKVLDGNDLNWIGSNYGSADAVTPVVIVVAADGSGQFKSVQEAVMSVPSGTADRPVVIRIKPGVYRELIYVQREKRFFRFVGDDAEKTVLTFDLRAGAVGLDGKPIGTFRTPSTVIDADDFIAENITFENAAGPQGQAVAIRVDGDRAVFRKCRFLGWQDTMLLNRGRQYFEDCSIAGHVDFVFGAATAFFERCHVDCRGDGYITAASTPADQPNGFVFAHCRITGGPGVRTYLGRPWRANAAVAFLWTDMSAVVRPEGWHNWDAPEREKTARYAEYRTVCDGASASRVAWARQLNEVEASALTANAVLGGTDNWKPASVKAER
jgi:pectinesterase